MNNQAVRYVVGLMLLLLATPVHAASLRWEITSNSDSPFCSTAMSASSATLTLRHSATLPSIPVGFSISITSGPLEATEIPACLWLRATNESGKAQYLKPVGGLPERCWEIPRGRRTIGPGVVETFEFDVEGPAGAFLEDPFLHESGTYRIKAVLGDDGKEPARTGAWTSNETLLLVRFQSDADAAAWAWLRDQYATWDSWGFRAGAVSRGLIELFPDSNYVPYVVMKVGGDDEERTRIVREVIVRFPNSPFRGELMLFLARHYEIELQRSLLRNDLERAGADLENAREWAGKAAGEIRGSRRQEAVRILDKLPDPADLRQLSGVRK